MELLLLALPIVFGIASVAIAVKAVSKGVKPSKAVGVQISTFISVFALCIIFPLTVGAATTDASTAVAAATDPGMGLIAAALATGLSCIGGGIAVASAAPAAIGATSEDPKAFGKALIFVALGEGIALYGLLISILILNKV